MEYQPANSDGPTRVAVADGHELSRKGLLALLERRPDLEIVGEICASDELEHTLFLRQPDVAVVVASLIDGPDDTTIQRVSARSPQTRFLLVSDTSAPTTIRRLFDAGAFGVIPADAHVADLFAAIDRLRDGDCYLHPVLGARLADARGTRDPLTERERAIARLIALGHTNFEVASEMYVSTRTVESHRAHIMAKLTLRNRSELVRWALDSRLIGPAPSRE